MIDLDSLMAAAIRDAASTNASVASVTAPAEPYRFKPPSGHIWHNHHDGLGPSVEWAREQLARFTYKPGWVFEVKTSHDLAAMDPYLGAVPYAARIQIHFKAEDTYHPGRTVEIGGQWSLYTFPDDADHFARRLAHIVKDLEVHESREWLRRDGEIFDNPHANDR